MNSAELMSRVHSLGYAVPSFNIPYIPMMEPIVRAVEDEDSVSMIAVARVEWMKFSSGGVEPIYREFIKHSDRRRTFLHLDHVPVIDEDDKPVNFEEILAEALDLGYQSVMVDGSRLSFEENIRETAKITEMAYVKHIPVEAELGKVMGHESGPIMSYEEILKTRTGFTDPQEARMFVEKTGCDWLSVACGNIHGGVSDLLRYQKKPAARLDIEHISILRKAAGVPLVLHGGSGVAAEILKDAVNSGISKVNVGTDLRQVYEESRKTDSVEHAQQRVYDRTREMLRTYFGITGLYSRLVQQEGPA